MSTKIARTFFLCSSIAILQSLIVQVAAQNDDTRTPRATGADVVRAAVLQIAESRIFPEDRQLLRRIAFVESRDGTANNTFRRGYFGGIWQVSFRAYTETRNVLSLITLHDAIRDYFNIDWVQSTNWRDLEKPLFSALAARLFLSTQSSQPISSDVNEQAMYWDAYYNMPQGFPSGIEHFTQAVSVLQSQESEDGKQTCMVIFVTVELHNWVCE